MLKKTISRRDFLKLLGLLGVGSAPGWFYATQIEPDWIETTEIGLTLPRLGKAFSGFRLVQLSDLHVGGWMTTDRLEKVVDQVVAIAPDLIVITGDFVYGYDLDIINRALDAMKAPLKRLVQSCQVLGVMGNHDRWLDVRKVRTMLAEVGIVELRNSLHSLRRGEEELHFCGVDDVKEGWDRLGAMMPLIPENGCAIMLAHEPDFADKTARRERFDAQFSGHSHGGQVVLPFVGSVILPYLAKKYSRGLYRVGDMYLYVNRGLGMAGISARFNCRPEITVFTLQSA